MLSSFLALLFVHQLGLMSPGPDFAVVMKNSLLSSRRAGWFTALGIMSGLAVHLTYTFSGLALIISQSIVLFSIVKYAGAAYLIWIGIKGLRAKRDVKNEDKSVPVGAGFKPVSTISTPAMSAFRQGFLTNVLNPKVTLFFLSVFSQFLTPETTLATKGLYAFVLLAQNILWFSCVATVFSAAPLRRKLGGIRRWLDRTMGAALVALGLKVALDHSK